MRWIKDKLNKKKERTQCEVKWKRTRKRNETNEHKRNYRGKFDWSFEALTCVRYVLTSLGARFGGHLIFLRNTSFFSRIDRVRCRCSSFSTRQDERSRCVYSQIVTYKFSWALLSWTTETRSKKPTVKRCVKQTFLCVVDETLQDNRSFRFFFTHTDATFTYLCATITIFPSYSIYSMDISIYIYVIYIECGAIRKDSELRYSCNTHWYIDSIDKWETARKEKYK